MHQQNNNFEQDIEALMVLGRAEATNTVRLDSSESTFKRLLSYKVLWISISKTLSDEKLNYLIKGIVRYDQSFDKAGYGFGGSASPGIILCKEYILRFPEKEKELMSWVIDNRVNPYLPYGSFMPSDN